MVSFKSLWNFAAENMFHAKDIDENVPNYE